MATTARDEYFMQLALEEAQAAFDLGEVPIGAIVVQGDTVVARAHNLRESWHDPTAHAEVIAIQRASRALARWRLTGCTLYATIEPCPMCAGAMVLARVDRLVYGAVDPKAGAVDTLYNVGRDPRLNHQVEVVRGVLEASCAGIMQDFFRRLRK